MSGSHLSREFFDLVKSIGECRSKQEEDKIIETEIALLKSKLSDPQNLQNPKKLKEFLIRSIYVEMLGHDASTFAYIHGVNLSHNKNLIAKRVGYLVSCLFLDPSNELMILLINTIQKDLKSSNLLEVAFALTVVSRLANEEMIPVLSSLVSPLLSHPAEMIRRRSVVAFHRLVQIGSDNITLQTVHQVLRKALGDTDPGVMAVGLNLLFDVARTETVSCADLVPIIVGILKQVIDHRLAKDFEYHRMPAPWIQMRLLSILGILGKENESASALMYDVLQETLRRADVGSNAGAAIVFDCLKCITSIVPSHTLLEYSSLMISKFMTSENHNYKYLGVTGLSLIVGINPAYANEHQMLVVDCLEDSDDTLRRKTIELLIQMANPNNVHVVVGKTLSQLDKDDDSVFKQQLVEKICSLCERFAPSNEWYLLTLNQVYSKMGCRVPDSVGENLTRLVAEQDGTDPVTGVDLRVTAANEYIAWLEKYIASDSKDSEFSPAFLKLMVWMVGEFAPLSTTEGYSVDDIVDLLVDAVKHMLGQEDAEPNNEVMGYMVTAISKISVTASSVAKSSSLSLFDALLESSEVSPDIHRRCREYSFVLRQPPHIQKALLPFDGSCEDIEIDLRFLDGFCSEARRNGAKQYCKPSERPVAASRHPQTVTGAATVLSGLRFEAYQAPPPVTASAPLAVKTSGLTTPVVVSPVSAKAQPIASPPGGSRGSPGPPQLQLGSAKKWGPQGFVGVAPQPPAQRTPERVEPAAPAVVKSVSVPSSSPSPPQLSQEYLEKQRTAAALFSGMGAGRPASVASAPKLSAQPRKNPSPQPSVSTDQATDLLDLGGSPPSAPQASTTHRKVSDMSDLLGIQ